MNKVTRKEWLLLSRFVDGDLPVEQRDRIQARIDSDAEFRATYEKLLHTRMVLRAVPQRKVPRNYTLTPEQAGIKESRPYLVWQYSSAFAALIAVVAFALQLISPSAMMRNVVYEQAPMEIMLEEETAAMDAVAEEAPPIIIWGPGSGQGLGGGGGDAGTQPMTAPEEGVGGGGIPEDAPMTFEAAPDDLAPAPEMAPMQVEPQEEQLEKSTDDSPILGIAPKEERGQIKEEQPTEEKAIPQDERVESPSVQSLYSIVTWIAFGLAVVSGGIAIFLKRRQN